VQFLRLVVPFDSGGGVLGLVLRSAPARQTVEGDGRSGGQAPSRKRSLRHNRSAGMRPNYFDSPDTASVGQSGYRGRTLVSSTRSGLGDNVANANCRMARDWTGVLARTLVGDKRAFWRGAAG
jgi:hypothetical protein